MLVCVRAVQAAYSPRKGSNPPGASSHIVRDPDFQPETRTPGTRKEGVCMTISQLPERASLEYLKKLAKERLAHMRSGDPKARLAAALLDVAREHGFSSWRALKDEVDRRREGAVVSFFTACATGD